MSWLLALGFITFCKTKRQFLIESGTLYIGEVVYIPSETLVLHYSQTSATLPRLYPGQKEDSNGTSSTCMSDSQCWTETPHDRHGALQPACPYPTCHVTTTTTTTSRSLHHHLECLTSHLSRLIHVHPSSIN